MSKLGQLRTCLNLMTTRQNSLLSPLKELCISIPYLLQSLTAMLNKSPECADLTAEQLKYDPVILKTIPAEMIEKTVETGENPLEKLWTFNITITITIT